MNLEKMSSDGGAPMSNELDKLLEMAKKVAMTQKELEEQRRSFAYGNARIENDRITREIIDKAADSFPAPKTIVR